MGPSYQALEKIRKHVVVERALGRSLETLFLFLAPPKAVWPFVGQSPSLSLKSFIYKTMVPDEPFLNLTSQDWPSLGLVPEKRGFVWGSTKEILVQGWACCMLHAARKQILLLVTMKISPLHVPDRLVTEQCGANQISVHFWLLSIRPRRNSATGESVNPAVNPARPPSKGKSVIRGHWDLS